MDEHGAPTQYVRDPRSGRLTAVGAVGGGPQSDSEKRKLYGDYGGWVNPDEVRNRQYHSFLFKCDRFKAVSCCFIIQMMATNVPVLHLVR